MTEDEITDLVKSARKIAWAFRDRAETATADEAELYWGDSEVFEKAAYALEAQQKEIADLKYRLEAARMFTEVGDFRDDEIDKMQEIVSNLLLHRRTKK